MSDQNFYVNLKNAGKVSILKDWNMPSYANQAALPTDIPELNADGGKTYQLAILEDTGRQVYFKGGLPAVEGAIVTTANGAWYSADKDQEVLISVANPPVDTWSKDTQVTGVAPTVTANTRLITWADAEGLVHLYQVDRNGSGVVTGYTEITSNKFSTIDDNTLESEADVLALSPLRYNTVYRNPDSGQTWVVDQYGQVTTLADGEYHVTLVTQALSLVAGTETVVSINDTEGGAVVLTRNPDILDGVTINAVNQYSMVIVARDPSNNNQLSVDGWAIRQIDSTSFGVTANVSTTVRLTAQFPAKKQ
jgi:hypothetical protein